MLKNSLKFKFIFGIALLVGLIITLNFYSALHRETDLLTASMNRSGKLLATTLAIACQDAIIEQKYDSFPQITERIITGDHNVQEISIIDELDRKYLAYGSREDDAENKLGNVVSEELSQKLTLMFENKDSFISSLSPKGDYIDYFASVKIGESVLGYVILRYSLESLKDNKQTSLFRNMTIALIAMLAGILISFILAKFITKGIDKLVIGTKAIENGDLSYRVESVSDDEVGKLAESFNNMLETLESKNKALDRKMFEIETLFKASQAMNFQSDTDKLIKQILEMAGKAIQAERCSIMLQTGTSTDEIETKIVQSFKGSQKLIIPEKTIKIKVGEGVAGTVLKTGNSIIVNDGHNDPLFKSFETSAEYEKSINTLISVPLKVKYNVTGVINGVNKINGGKFNEDDQRLLEALAQQAAMAVEHARLYELAITDGLTKLFIHRYFQARLEEELVRAKRYHTTCSLIMFDIDHFKKFNDTYGHQQGDIVLMEVAKLIKQTIRETVDIPARYGGEEFTIILPETDAAGAHLVAERLRKTVEAYDFPGQEQSLKVTISLGVATFPDHASVKSVLIKKADQALYACKDNGRNCSLIYNDSFADKGE